MSDKDKSKGQVFGYDRKGGLVIQVSFEAILLVSIIFFFIIIFTAPDYESKVLFSEFMKDLATGFLGYAARDIQVAHERYVSNLTPYIQSKSSNYTSSDYNTEEQFPSTYPNPSNEYESLLNLQQDLEAQLVEINEKLNSIC